MAVPKKKKYNPNLNVRPEPRSQAFLFNQAGQNPRLQPIIQQKSKASPRYRDLPRWAPLLETLALFGSLLPRTWWNFSRNYEMSGHFQQNYASRREETSPIDWSPLSFDLPKSLGHLTSKPLKAYTSLADKEASGLNTSEFDFGRLDIDLEELVMADPSVKEAFLLGRQSIKTPLSY